MPGLTVGMKAGPSAPFAPEVMRDGDVVWILRAALARTTGVVEADDLPAPWVPDPARQLP